MDFHALLMNNLERRVLRIEHTTVHSRSTFTNTFMLSNIGCAVVLCKTIRIDLHALLMNNVEHRVLRTERTIVHLS